jgi:hypothetical protein
VSLLVIIALAAAGLISWGTLAKFGELRRKHGMHNLIGRALTMRPLHGPAHHKTDATFWAQSSDRASGKSGGRHHRAGWHNLCISLSALTAVGLTLYGLAADKLLTAACLIAAAAGAAGFGVLAGIRRARAVHRNRAVIAPLAVAAEAIIDPDRSLSTNRGSMIEMERDWLTRKSGQLGVMTLPDAFHANDLQRESLENLISARLPVPVRFSWRTREMPQQVRIIAAPPLPRKVLFRDHLDAIEALGPGVFAVGLDGHGNLYAESHNGDTPWTARSMNSGTGKSVMFAVKAAQIAHKNPAARIVCVDTKQVSFAPLRGIPGIEIYDDPSDMGSIYSVFGSLAATMRDRYTALKADPAAADDMNDIWLFVDEGNDLAVQLQAYWQRELRESAKDPKTPPVWLDSIGPLVWQGRQVKIRGTFALQSLMEKYVGGINLRPSFGVIGMAGYKPSQFRSIIGTTPVPALQTGPGRILMCRGSDEEWVQSLYDDPGYLRAYAEANRRPAVPSGPERVRA